LVRAYQKEVQRQQMLVRKAAFAQQKLLFVVGALRELFADENFVNLLRAEGLDTLPKYMAERLATTGDQYGTQSILRFF
jgi:ParB family chromosome partitioning protein